jgi:hypothetical protein
MNARIDFSEMVRRTLVVVAMAVLLPSVVPIPVAVPVVVVLNPALISVPITHKVLLAIVTRHNPASP